ncbi:VOC family protein [Chitinophaga sp. GCM10012297]|uniref:VOC family protein n=1 Tax=Chitinophaga chungangae TaxID=2821488 RepID=A0ABS3YA55_9BACT|nr:VOC family protein [Chitinophaga chungangae]MBO9151511.1 VOC family protein [Chitinophaga chungangae]
MATTNKPAGIPTLCPYFLMPDGNRFLSFLQNVFGAEEHAVYRNDDGGIMHAEMRIGDSVVMFGNSNEQYPPQTGGVFMYVSNTDEVYYKALAEGATSEAVPENKDYGRSAGVKDMFGNMWWITQL